MQDRNFGGRMLAFLSSLRLAVVTMVTLGAVCGYATFYEMQNGTPAAQRDIYQTPWFAFILGILGLNVFSVMVSRYPWTKHHTGFLIAHVGILLVLAGSVVFALPGPRLEHGALRRRDVRPGCAPREGPAGIGAGPGGERDVPGGVREEGARSGSREAVPRGSDVVLVADEYHPHVSVVEAFEPAAAGAPALHFVLQAPMVTQEQWLVADDPQRSHLDLGMVSFGFHAASSDAQVKELLGHSEGANHLSFVAAPAASCSSPPPPHRAPLRRAPSKPASPSRPAGRRWA